VLLRLLEPLDWAPVYFWWDGAIDRAGKGGAELG
jgi:hypothetical protein